MTIPPEDWPLVERLMKAAEARYAIGQELNTVPFLESLALSDRYRDAGKEFDDAGDAYAARAKKGAEHAKT